jgi:hypothetical protein
LEAPLLPQPARWLAGSLLYLGAAGSAQAQAWDDRLPNVVTVGFGSSAGGVGISYLRQLPSVPLAVGAGFGVLGPSAHIDVTLPGISTPSPFGDLEEAEGRAYVGVGILVITRRDSQSYGTGDLFLEGGTQVWPQGGGGRFFTDLALGVSIRAWGTAANSSIGPSFRAQVGYAF